MLRNLQTIPYLELNMLFGTFFNLLDLPRQNFLLKLQFVYNKSELLFVVYSKIIVLDKCFMVR